VPTTIIVMNVTTNICKISDQGYLKYAVSDKGLIVATFFHSSPELADHALISLQNNMELDMILPAQSVDFKWWNWAFQSYFSGGETALNPGQVPLDDSSWSPFRKRIYLTLRDQVYWGDTISYGELAALAGSPGAARAVGTAMSQNTGGPFIPCHRVVGAGGKLGGYSGNGGLDLKRKLLSFELNNPVTASSDQEHP